MCVCVFFFLILTKKIKIKISRGGSPPPSVHQATRSHKRTARNLHFQTLLTISLFTESPTKVSLTFSSSPVLQLSFADASLGCTPPASSKHNHISFYISQALTQSIALSEEIPFSRSQEGVICTARIRPADLRSLV
jgi:hypothetical protein